jgi:hypothetical protein
MKLTNMAASRESALTKIPKFPLERTDLLVSFGAGSACLRHARSYFANWMRHKNHRHLMWEYILARADLMYYYCLDIPLGIGFVQDQRIALLNRDFQDLRSIEDFFVASIPTVAVFYRHIFQYNKFELEQLEERFRKSPCGLDALIRIDVYREFLELPPHWQINLELLVKRGIEARRPELRDRAEKLKRNIEEVLTYR